MLNALGLTLKFYVFIAFKLSISVSAKINVCPVQMNVFNANQVDVLYASKDSILIYKTVLLVQLDVKVVQPNNFVLVAKMAIILI